MHCFQGISVDMDDEYDPVAYAEQAQLDRQRELEAEAELRVSQTSVRNLHISDQLLWTMLRTTLRTWSVLQT